MSADQVLSLSLHDYQACLFHFAKTQGGEEEEEVPLGEADFDEMLVSLAGAGMIN